MKSIKLIFIISITFFVNITAALSQDDYKKDSWYIFFHINDVDYDTALMPIPSTNEFKNLSQFIGQIEELVENYKWDDYISLCDEGHYLTQKKNGENDPSYICGTLCLNFVNNHLGCKKEIITFKCLEKIERLELIGIPKVQIINENFFNVFGYAYLKNGTKLRFSIVVIKKDNAYKISGGVG